MEIISDKFVKTRKSHVCYACLRKFPVGTWMNVQVNKYEGEINAFYSCETCNTLIDKFGSLLTDPDENLYTEGCVAELCQINNVDSPEQLFEGLTTDKTEKP